MSNRLWFFRVGSFHLVLISTIRIFRIEFFFRNFYFSIRKFKHSCLWNVPNFKSGVILIFFMSKFLTIILKWRILNFESKVSKSNLRWTSWIFLLEIFKIQFKLVHYDFSSRKKRLMKITYRKPYHLNLNKYWNFALFENSAECLYIILRF